MLTHEQIEVKYRQTMIKVDIGMATLLAKLWACGILTAHSCQGPPGYIHFTDWASVVKFHLEFGMFDYASAVGGEWTITASPDREPLISFRFEELDKLIALVTL